MLENYINASFYLKAKVHKLNNISRVIILFSKETEGGKNRPVPEQHLSIYSILFDIYTVKVYPAGIMGIEVFDITAASFHNTWGVNSYNR